MNRMISQSNTMGDDRMFADLPETIARGESVRSVNVDSVNRLVEAARIADGFDMEKILRAASDIGGYAPETDARYEPNSHR